jgi:hypothetical protein
MIYPPHNCTKYGAPHARNLTINLCQSQTFPKFTFQYDISVTDSPQASAVAAATAAAALDKCQTI